VQRPGDLEFRDVLGHAQVELQQEGNRLGRDLGAGLGKQRHEARRLQGRQHVFSAQELQHAGDGVAAADAVVDEAVPGAVDRLEVDRLLRHQPGQVNQAGRNAEPVRRFEPRAPLARDGQDFFLGNRDIHGDHYAHLQISAQMLTK